MYKKISENPLYNMKSINKLKNLLFFDENLVLQTQYNVFCANKGERLVEQPLGELNTIHKRIFKFLKLIEQPDYLMSKKKSSNIVNASKHLRSNYVVTLDISKYFPKCSHAHVYQFFLNTMKNSVDNAKFLADVCTIDISKMMLSENVKIWYEKCNSQLKFSIPDSHIPTGSSLSQLLAFLSYENMFEEINLLCKKNNLIFTLYVDDIIISSNNRIKKSIVKNVYYIATKYGHEINMDKVKYYGPSNSKKITGVHINVQNKLSAPSRIHKEIVELAKELSNEKNPLKLQKFFGKANYVNAVESGKFRELIKHVKKMK